MSREKKGDEITITVLKSQYEELVRKAEGRIEIARVYGDLIVELLTKIASYEADCSPDRDIIAGCAISSSHHNSDLKGCKKTANEASNFFAAFHRSQPATTQENNGGIDESSN